MSAALRLPGMILWLVVLWIMLWGSLTWANVLAGLAIAALVVFVARLRPSSLRASHFRPHWALWFAIVLIGKLLQSNLRIAWEVLTPGDNTSTAILAVPMRGGSDAVVTAVANSITLTPGTMTVDIVDHYDDILHGPVIVDAQGRPVVDERGVPIRSAGLTLYVHSMFARDVEDVRHEVLQLEARALRAFGSREDYAIAAAEVVAHEAELDPSHRRDRRRTERGDS